jgi:hypothetical protein
MVALDYPWRLGGDALRAPISHLGSGTEVIVGTLPPGMALWRCYLLGNASHI